MLGGPMRTHQLLVCVLVPRFALRVAVRGPLPDEPVALAPEPGDAPPLIGEVNAAAATHGVRSGMRVGEAIALCPRIQMITADPGTVADAAEALLVRLEGLGAAVEPLAPGAALFAADGLLRMHGGARRLLSATAEVLPTGGRVGAGPGRFIARSAAQRARPGRPVLVGHESAAGFVQGLPVDRLEAPPQLTGELAALGIRTAGELAALPLPAVADRLGPDGIALWRMARGEDERHVCPRTPPEPLREAISFPEAVGNEITLRQAAVVLLERLLAAPRRRGRPVRTMVLSAQLAAGGSWRRQLTLREATAEPSRLRDALLPRLTDLPGAIDRISLELAELGDAGGHQQALIRPAQELRRERAAEAARQLRAGMGEGHLLRVVEVAPWSRIPEGRNLLVPFEGS
jgi:nucleotidyltransferase/DNA polymerase involved in DNA repair